jgi:5-methylcytosine-specific restriction protein B
MDFTKQELINAIEHIDKNPDLIKGRKSLYYYLDYNSKEYPPILVLSVANQMKGGKELTLEDFNNNINLPFKKLKELNFVILSKKKDNKKLFENWMKKSSKDTSGTVSSYMSSLEYLSTLFYKRGAIPFESIFEIDNIQLIKELYDEVVKIQRDENSYIYNPSSPSYGLKGFYSASLNKYISFLNSEKKINKLENVNFDLYLLHLKFKSSRLIFSKTIITRFSASLLTKPFVICSGLSGSGKTKLAQAFAMWICEDESQYLIVPVGADWTNREPLLGYPNALNKEEYVSPENGVLDLMISAKQNIENTEEATKPYFLILDEMNLSHVERYFADFLSTMESGDKIPLHKIEKESLIVPQSIKLPKNLFIIGTVNIDETTYMFSPKVLDRANTIEFRLSEDDMKEYFSLKTKLNLDLLKAEGANMAESFMSLAMQETENNFDGSRGDLLNFFAELKKSGAEFGYRTANEIGRLMKMLETLGEVGDNLLDIAIMQKLLPKLHGSRNKLSKVLPTLASFCMKNNAASVKEDYLDKFQKNEITEKTINDDDNIKYKISFLKICRMYKNAVENGFASYAEA